MPWLRKFRIADDADIPEDLVMLKLTSGSNTKYEKINEQRKKTTRRSKGKMQRNQGDTDDETNIDNLLEMNRNLQRKIDRARKKRGKTKFSRKIT
mmetsp:Transcript_31732/g.48203  ORF Transcript_31732/g.48203 Transcript_31732/m.48203 type:complete len:95 (+) Transcript_31732:1691-1975(+)